MGSADEGCGMSREVMTDVCDVCGSANVQEIKCKLICGNCGTILRSCADLGVDIHRKFIHTAHPVE